jgi:hypothetical protein
MVGKNLFEIDFSVDAAEAADFSKAHLKMLGGSGVFQPRRESSVLIEEGRKIVQAALEECIFSICPNAPLISPMSTCGSLGAVSDIDSGPAKETVIDILQSDLGKSFVAYIGSRGPFTESRFWLRVGDAEFEMNGLHGQIVVGFNILVKNGNHGAVIAAYCQSISNYLAKGGESSLISFMKASSKPVDDSVLKFAFKKGMHARGFPKDKVQDLLYDLEVVFRSMKNAKGKAVIPALKFLDKKLVKNLST